MGQLAMLPWCYRWLAINPCPQREELGFKVVCIQRAVWFRLRSANTEAVVADLELSGLTHPFSRWEGHVLQLKRTPSSSIQFGFYI